MKKKIGYLLFLSLVIFTLTGCWDYTEIERVNFVFGAGIDQVDPDFTLVTEIIKSIGIGQEAEFEPKVLSTKGRTMGSNVRALVNPAGRLLRWAHAQVFIVSEEVAKDGVLPAIEYIIRATDLRSTVYFLVARDCTSEEIFKSKPPFSGSVSEHLVNLMDSHSQLPEFFPQQLWEFTNMLVKSGISGVLPTVELVNEGGYEVPVINGTALFKEDQMVGWIDGQESQVFSLLRGSAISNHFVMDTHIEEKVQPVTYEIRGSQVEIIPEVNGEKITMRIKIDLQIDVLELPLADIDFLEGSLLQSVEKQVATFFRNRTEELIWKMQDEYNADVVGFGLHLKRQLPNEWRARSKDWDEHFRNLNIIVEVKCRVVATGVAPRTIQMRH